MEAVVLKARLGLWPAHELEYGMDRQPAEAAYVVFVDF